MQSTSWPLLVIGLVIGVASGAGGALALQPKKPPPPAPVCPEPPHEEDEDELVAANASLVRSLQQCNRKLSELGQRRVEPTPAPSASAAPREGRGERRGGRRGPPTREDWERYAEQGVVPYQIPCLRDTPYVPTERDLERLNLSPDDAETLKQAYAKSNERVLAQLRPLCGTALGSPEVAERIGPEACMKAVLDGARRSDPEKMRQSLVNVAEVNAGKRPAGDKVDPTEALLLTLTAEREKFQADLAASLGPEDAQRIASARGLCSDRGFASADGRPPRGNGGGGRRGR